ncbi:MAG TPA: hypothetical protein VJ550_07995 [Geomonas sp.]|nr:hypothetical protein [Geomonas sp.]
MSMPVKMAAAVTATIVTTAIMAAAITATIVTTAIMPAAITATIISAAVVPASVVSTTAAKVACRGLTTANMATATEGDGISRPGPSQRQSESRH